MDNPIPHVEDVYFYSRENNILIANKTNGEKVPLVKFKQTFPDKLILESKHIDYMQDYMKMFPELWENVLKMKKPTIIKTTKLYEKFRYKMV